MLARRIEPTMLVVAAIILIAYALPVLLEPAPSGTDVYSHIFYTRLMVASNSSADFYEKALSSDYSTYEYPFGLWLFGAATSKVTGLEAYDISYILPLLIILIIVASCQAYSKELSGSSRTGFLPAIFLLSMPVISMLLLEYRPSVFTMPFVLVILHLSQKKGASLVKFICLSTIVVFCLCFTHTGTYMFLLFFIVAYSFVYALLTGEINKRAYILIFIMLLVYPLATGIFPYVYPQYTDKSYLIVTVGTFLSNKLHLPFMYELTQLFYEKVFVERSILDIVLWSGFAYSFMSLIVQARRKMINWFKGRRTSGTEKRIAQVAPLAPVQKLSHTVVATPFWTGPLQSLLVIPGCFRLGLSGKSILISALLVTILPALLVTSYTGAVREIFYLYIIIPVTAALGFLFFLERIGKVRQEMRQRLFLALFLLIFAAGVISPAVGNLYFKPPITGSSEEKTGLSWLREVGTPDDGVTGWGYRHMINIFSGKKVPEATTVESGSETRLFGNTILAVYFSNRSESKAEELYNVFGVNYFISSPRVLDNLQKTKRDLRIDSNTQVDKVYATKEDFYIYKLINPKAVNTNSTAVFEQVLIAQDRPEIDDMGADYLVKTKAYQMRIGKYSPTIRYFGEGRENFLGEGDTYDYVKILWAGRDKPDSIEYIFSEMNFSSSISGNNIYYNKRLGNQNGSESWATLTIKYTFYENAVKNEITVSNDWLEPGMPMIVYAGTKSFLPFNSFVYDDPYASVEKKVYPAEDPLRIKDTEFANMFFYGGGGKGIYIEYDKTGSSPTGMNYKGSLSNANYSTFDIFASISLQPGRTMEIRRYYAAGGLQEAKESVKTCSYFSLYPYQNASTPVVLTSYLDSMAQTPAGYLENSLDTYYYLKEAGLVGSFTEGVSFKYANWNETFFSRVERSGVSIMGYADQSIDNMTRDGKLEGIDITGFVPKGLSSSLAEVNRSKELNISYIVSGLVDIPSEGVSQGGLRNPQFAYYRGNKTQVIILQVSLPTSSRLQPEYSMNDTLRILNTVTAYSIKNHEAAVLLLRSPQIGSPEYINSIIGFLGEANLSGMSFTTPSEIAGHARLMSMLRANVSAQVDTVVAVLSNGNPEPIKGASFRVSMPRIGNGCPYAARNGRIAKIEQRGDLCVCYVSLDIGASENKTVMIEPSMEKNKFSLEAVRAFENDAEILIKDQKGNNVPNAKVTIGSNTYRSDPSGRVKPQLKRGVYDLQVEKPGFESMKFRFSIQNRILHLETVPWAYVACAVVLIAAVYAIFRRMKKPKKTHL
jgi:hypothetical protein